VLLEWTRWSLISLISTVALFVIITSFLWATLANALNRCGLCHPQQPGSCIVIMRLTRNVVQHPCPILPTSPAWPLLINRLLTRFVVMQAGPAGAGAAARGRE